MIVDFHHHFYPDVSNLPDHPITYYAFGIPAYSRHKLLGDLDEHFRVMNEAGIDVSVLTSGSGMRGKPDVARAANEELSKVCAKYPERLRFLAHASVGGNDDSFSEVKRWLDVVPGVVVPSTFGEVELDDPKLEPLYSLLENRGRYLFVHPVIEVTELDARNYGAYDLSRMVGREFSLVVTTVRLISGGVLDRHPNLKIIISHLGGGISSILPRIVHYHDKELWGIAGDPVHGKTPKEPFETYMEKMYFDTGGFFGDINTIRIALMYFPKDRILFGTDYPQEIRGPEPMEDLIKELRSQGMLENGGNLLNL